jgi:Domain of unknown function (DUF4153)
MPTFGPQWPGPGRTAGPGVIIAALVTAFVAAGLLGWDRPGIGWFVTGLVGATAVTIVARLDGGSARVYSGSTVWRGVWALLALALLAAGGVRAAEWLWLLCLPTACLCGALALAGGRRVRSLAIGVVAVPIAAVRALPWAARGLAGVRGRTTSSAVRILAALVVSLVLLLIFGGLLAGADAVFASVVDKILPTVDGGVVARWIWNFVLLFFGTLAACFLAIKPPAFDGDAAQGGKGEQDGAAPRRSLGRLEWGVPVGTLVLLFGAFVGIGAAASFGGDGYVQRTAGLTYAEYARQGFWQLLAVTVLTLLVLAIAARVARRETPADRLWIRVLLGLLALLTLVIVASALNRMRLYEQTYGYTVLRLLVSICEGWLGLVFVMVLVAGARLRASWLPRAMVASAALALVGLVAVNPDYLIARQNVLRYESLHRIDLWYLQGLSADAVPAFDALPKEMRDCVVRDIDENLGEQGPDEPRQWNLGRARARQLLADYVPVETWYPFCSQVFDRSE